MEAETPLVSVVLNTYNRPDLLRQSVASVLAQDYPNFEVIIVDDCSPDNTPEVVAGIVAQHPDRVRSLRLPENRGLAAARNAGIRAARGELIAFQDDDDLWLPGKLTAQVEALNRHPECGLCYGNALVATADGVPTRKVYDGSGVGRTGDSFEPMLRWHVILGPTLMVRSSVFDTVGLFDETLRTAEDTDLFLRLTMRHFTAYVARPLVLVREHTGRKTRGESLSGTRAQCSLRLYGRLWDTLPPEREHLRGVVAEHLARSALELAERANEAPLDEAGLMDVIEAHPAWFEYPEALWWIADRLVSNGSASVHQVPRMAAMLRERASDGRQGRRRAAMFLNVAVRRGLRHGMPLQAVGWAARYALALPAVLRDRIGAPEPPSEEGKDT